MSSASAYASRVARGSARSTPEGRGGRWALGIALALLLMLLVLFVAWFMGWLRFATDPRVLEIQRMQTEMRESLFKNGGPRTLTEASTAMASMGQVRAKIEALPPDLKRQVERSGGNFFRSAMRARVDAYFALPADKRRAELDRQIDQEEMMRKAAELVGLGRGREGSGGSGDAAPRGGPPRSSSEEDRNRWRKQIIDNTTPEQRAEYVEYRQAMEQRRQQRGMPASPWGR